MGAIIYDEFQTTPDGLIAALKAAILTSTDWSQVATWYEALPPISAAEAVGQTNLSATGMTGTSGFPGDTVVIDRGTAEEETLTVSSYNASNIITTTATAFAHDVGSTIERVHAHTVKSVTADGAELILDLSEAPPTNRRVGMAGYRTMVGATPTDKRAVYPPYMSSAAGTTTTLPVHVFVAAGKDFLFINLMGPRSGEPFAESNPWSDPVFLGRVLNYDPADTSKPVYLAGRGNDSSTGTAIPNGWVNRNAGDTTSWVIAFLGTICYPSTYDSATSPTHLNPTRNGKRFFWPYVISEVEDGPRGRLKDVFFAGVNAARAGYQYDVPGRRYTKDGITYQAVVPTRASTGTVGHFGSNDPSALAMVLIPVAGTPA